mgnify:CR=1 FL=1
MMQLNERDLNLLVLRYFAKTPKAHKMNVLGRTYQDGALETELGRQFTPEERSQVARIFPNLIKDGLLEPTYDDMVDPENWLRITEAGRSAEKRGAPDDLDLMLMELSPQLAERRRGAWAAAASTLPDAPSQAASSARELIDQLLHHLAPADKIKAQPDFVPAQGSQSGISRAMRIKYAMNNRKGGPSKNDSEIVDRAIKLIESLQKKLSALTHSREQSTPREVMIVLPVMEAVLQLLLY